MWPFCGEDEKGADAILLEYKVLSLQTSSWASLTQRRRRLFCEQTLASSTIMSRNLSLSSLANWTPDNYGRLQEKLMEFYQGLSK